MMDLKVFLQHNVEGYLFEDLQTMKAASVAAGKTAGAVGYPLVLSAFAGIELLGGLVSLTSFDPKKGNEYFCAYWKDYLYPDNAARSAAGATLYKLVRHGLAHVFVTKGPITIVKHYPRMHLVRGVDGTLYVDAAQLADDLRGSYETRVKPLVDTTAAGRVDGASMAQRFKEMATAYSEQARPLLAQLTLPAAPTGPSMPMSQSNTPIASGAEVPTVITSKSST